jgi:hypothetical protein
VVDEEVRDIRRPAGPQDPLLRPEGKRPLERYENDGEYEQVQQKPVEPEVNPIIEVAAYLDIRTAQDDRCERERKRRETERLAPAQQHVEAGAEKRDSDDELDQRAHGGHGVPCAQFRRRQQIRKMKHDNGAESRCAEEDAGDAADPAGADMPRRIVTQPAG